MLSIIIQDYFVFPEVLNAYYCKDSFQYHKSIYFVFFKMMYRDLKEVCGAEAQMLSWQHTSYLSLNFVRNICCIVSYVRCSLETMVKICKILKF